jgi:phage-related protein
MTTSAIILRESEKSLQAGVWLFTLQIEIPSGPTLYRVCNTESLVYAGQTWTPWSFVLTGFSMSTEGDIPSPSLEVDKTNSEIGQYMADYDGLQGAVVRIEFVNSLYLNEDYSPDAIVVKIDGSTNTLTTVSFKLIPDGLRPRVTVPCRNCEGWICDRRFRLSAYCGYDSTSISGITIPASGPLVVQMTGHPFVTGDTVYLEGVVGISPSLNCAVQKRIKSITISSGNPLLITTRTAHRLVTGDTVVLSNVRGITPKPNGSWTITRSGSGSFTLDSTDGADYTGTYIPGGLAALDGADPYTVTRIDANSFSLDDTEGADYSGTFSIGYAGFSACPKHLAACELRSRQTWFGAFPFCRGDGVKFAI